tara:strand:+ start:299 stop:481 length:183 start_codon:yes stop_codon:yes gene_type:complete
MIQAGDLVKIIDGGWNGCFALVMFKPFDNVARVKILDPIARNEYSINGYVAYNTASLEVV